MSYTTVRTLKNSTGFEVFHTLPTARIWRHLTSGCSSQETSKKIHFTGDEQVQAAMGKWFQEQPEDLYSDGFKSLVQHW
jgi:hypothetical protein